MEPLVEDAAAGSTGESRSARLRRLPTASTLRRLAATLGLTAAVLSVLLHLTVRDAVWPLSAAFYALPCWVAVAGAAFGALLLRRSRRRKAAAAFAAALLVWCLLKDVRPFTSPPEPDADADRFTLMMWNPFFGRMGWDRVAETIEAADADVVCMVEGGPRKPKAMDRWRRDLPMYTPTHCGYAFCILSKHPVRVLSDTTVRPPDDRVEAEVLLHGRWVRLVLFHPKSSPLYDRSRVAASLVRRAVELSETPSVVCGDFNLPTNSAHLDALRRTHALASDAGGFGFRPTWPAWLPVLTLDQVWCGGGLRPVDCRHVWTTASDHRPVVTTVELPEPR